MRLARKDLRPLHADSRGSGRPALPDTLSYGRTQVRDMKNIVKHFEITVSFSFHGYNRQRNRSLFMNSQELLNPATVQNLSRSQVPPIRSLSPRPAEPRLQEPDEPG